MRDPLRIERILNLIEELWLQYPDWRLGQLLVNVSDLLETNTFFVEDDKVEAGLITYLKQVEAHRA